MYLLEVYVTNASLNINHSFTYYSDIEVLKYVRVKIRFSNSIILGIVSDIKYTSKSIDEVNNKKGYKLSKIIEVVDDKPIINEELFNLCLWLSKTTVSPFITCLNCMLPKALKTKKEATIPKLITYIKINFNNDIQLTKKQSEVLSKCYDDMLLSEARKHSPSIINTLINKKIIEVYTKEAEYINDKVDIDSFKTLTIDQENAYKSIIDTDKKVSLLFGITGSGKTEVYLHLAKYYLEQNKEILILVPEISLTPQMIQRVKQRFSDVVFYHSELSDQERYEQYKRVKDGETKIVVGTRSSIFLPFNDLGLIIVDEEHDSSYKQDNMPCYHVRNVAFKRAYSFSAKVLLASATPSLESYTRAKKGEYNLVELKKRINNQLPNISIIDLNKSLHKNNNYIITNELKDALDETLRKNEQAFILLNRRGYAPIVKCSNCDVVLKCLDCDIALNYHKDENILKCHHCGRIYKTIDICPACKKPLIYYGFGTKKVEEELNKLYPNKNIYRMDKDNVNKKGSHKQILDKLDRHEIDILIGTQMIAKGLDYPNVTLVGILNADAGLMHQDYNSTKTTFDLLMQASGRSGRADNKGNVIIQAFNADHYVLKAVLNQNFEYFYNIEMNYRNKVAYPPYSHIVELLLYDFNKERLNRSVDNLYKLVSKYNHKTYKPYELLKIQKNYRYRILIMDKDLVSMIKDTHLIIDEYINFKGASKIKVDIDPLYLE